MNTLITPTVQHWLDTLSPNDAWLKIAREVLSPEQPFEQHFQLFARCYPNWEHNPASAVIWQPPANNPCPTALETCLNELSCGSLQAFHALSVCDQEQFWQHLLMKMNIRFQAFPEKICDLVNGPEFPHWLPKARFNIVDSCFTANSKTTAIIQYNEKGELEYYSYADLQEKVAQIAASLIHAGCSHNDSIGLMMPMHFTAVASFLAIIKIGARVVTIAESFSSDEIARRLNTATAKIILTQDYFSRDGKEIALYAKIIASNGPPAVVITAKKSVERPEDIVWDAFHSTDQITQSHPCSAQMHSVILFSSGTTGIPKAIPWTHATPLKSASDALLHHNLTEGDVLNWPTSLGWMMGPWQVFAALINRATLALYTDTPLNAAFGKFVENAGVTVQGVVPTLVAAWRNNQCLAKANWKTIRLFTSTGECSNAIDMLWLSSRAGYKPIIEYCGGTEIGGAYLSSTLLQENCPSVFTTPAMGSNFLLINDAGQPADLGEVALLSPAMGQSLELLNADHHAVYFKDMPKLANHDLLRRHGDYIQRLPNGKYRMLGRNDDTMNLGGIKISAAEIERALSRSPLITEAAAVGTHLESGPTRLIIYAVSSSQHTPEELKKSLQNEINSHLNPLFRISQVILVDALPKTISGKIMRRMLREK